MPATRKKTTRTERKTTKPKRPKAGTGQKTTRARRPAKPKAKTRTFHHKAEETTFVYECTRPGCGYRIWREESDEPGHLRFDLKCPKCHHKVFRCHGKGDVPESFQVPPQPAQLDFNTMKTTDLGSN